MNSGMTMGAETASLGPSQEEAKSALRDKLANNPHEVVQAIMEQTGEMLKNVAEEMGKMRKQIERLEQHIHDQHGLVCVRMSDVNQENYPQPSLTHEMHMGQMAWVGVAAKL